MNHNKIPTREQALAESKRIEIETAIKFKEIFGYDMRPAHHKTFAYQSLRYGVACRRFFYTFVNEIGLVKFVNWIDAKLSRAK